MTLDAFKLAPFRLVWVPSIGKNSWTFNGPISFQCLATMAFRSMKYAPVFLATASAHSGYSASLTTSPFSHLFRGTREQTIGIAPLAWASVINFRKYHPYV